MVLILQLSFLVYLYKRFNLLVFPITLHTEEETERQ